MRKKIDKESVKRLLIEYYVKHYVKSSYDEECHRELLVHPISGRMGVYFLEISGSEPKGYGIYFSSYSNHILTLFDCHGKRFKDFYLDYGINFDLE